MFDDQAIQDRATMLQRLLPPGPAWTAGARGDETMPKLLRALATELARVAGDFDAFADAFYPDTAEAFLPDWERVLKLSHDGDAESRQLRILTKLRGYMDPSEPNIRALIQTYNPAADVEARPYVQFRVGVSAVGDPLRGDPWTSTFRVTYDAAGGVNTELEAAVLEAKPLHTTAEFVAYAP